MKLTVGSIPHCLLTALAVLALSVASPADVTIVREGKPLGVILVDPNATDQAKGAAAEFQSFIERMSGAKLPIITDGSGASGVKVIIGQGSEAKKMEPNIPGGFSASFNEEGFVIKTADTVVLLAGNETSPYEGTYYAVYDCLQRLGCRWYFPGEFGEIVPRKTTITLPDLSMRLKPDFRVRDIWYSGFIASSPEQQEEFQVWKRRNKLTHRGFYLNSTMPEATFLQNPVDGSTSKLLPEEEYFGKHPEYYAQNPDGSRNKEMPCMTNEAAIAASAETICRFFAENPNAYSYAFSPPDAPVICSCENCKALSRGGYGDEGHGEASDPFFTYMDKVARIVHQRYPDRWLGTMAYYNRFRPTQGLDAPWPNVYVQMADMWNCPLHGYDKDGCKLSEHIKSMAEQWERQAAALLYYEYDPFDWGKMHRPVWGSERISGNYKWLKAHNGWGFTVESQMDYASLGINNYLRGRLSWNVNEPVQEIVHEFHKTFFGPASEPMSSYYSLIENHLWSNKHHIYSGWSGMDSQAAVWTNDVLKKARSFLNDAEKLAVDEPYKSRVVAFRAGFDRLDAARRCYEAAARGDFPQAVREADEMLRIVDRLGNSSFLVDDGSTIYKGWLSGTALKEAFTPWADKFSKNGKILAVFPEKARFRLDPVPEGLVFEWYSPTLDDTKEWKPLRLDQSWHVQGVEGLGGSEYTGIAWYRTSLDLPSIGKDEKVRLSMPAVQGKAVWVWVNGDLAGYSTAQDGFDFDLSGRVRPGKNLFAFRVDGGDSNIRKIPFFGTGGICLRPIVYKVKE